MKLYSRSQLIKFSAIGMVFAAVAASLITSVSLKKSKSAMPETTAQNTKNQDSESKDKNEFTLLQSENNDEKNGKNAAFTVSATETNYTQDEIQNINVYQKCAPGVVNINTQVAGVNWFLEPVVQDGGSGSGSIIDKRGYVLTNGHVVKGASKIYVSLSDGTQYEAKIIGQDRDSDLTVIKFDPPEGLVLQTISFGDSTKLNVGQKVIAIGNPYGFNRTMTTGIVSALGRPVKNPNTQRIIRNMIQTDTAINPGNSGGPLLDTSGKMIGVNTMIYSSSGSSAGIGFSVPAETAIRVVSDLLQYGKVRRGQLDVTLVQLNNTIANYANLDISSGLLVSRIQKGGNAEKAGIIQGTQAVRYGYNQNIIYLGGDIITNIDGINIASYTDYYSALESKKPGDTVTITVHRNGKDRKITVTLSEESAVL
ncbi:MAG: trypsin-like peptidase domain-containing protein [Treponema sp.]|jgi:S1-C subfamily serine protease|nr:trypsin-like peptidase domain-containing protein [Treponema sp.]